MLVTTAAPQVFDIYPAYAPQEIEAAVEEIFQFLSADPNEATYKASDIAAYAAQCFRDMPPGTLERMSQITTLLQQIPPEKLEDKKHSDFYKKLFKIFFKLHADIQQLSGQKNGAPSVGALSNKQVLLTKQVDLKNRSETDNKIPPPPRPIKEVRSATAPPKLTTDDKEDALVKADQINKICQFFHLFLEHYVPFYDQGNTPYKKSILARFDKLFPYFVDRFFLP